MAKSSLVSLKRTDVEAAIYSDKSSLILFWLLVNHSLAAQEGFSINELGRSHELSVGLVHKVITRLEYEGIVVSKGLRTGKRFYLKSPEKILLDWISEYSLLRKAKAKGFANSSLQFEKSKFEGLKLVPALHLASSEYFHLKSTNLRSKEFYVLQWENLPKIIDRLNLIEMDRGYEVLLIKPYYSTLLSRFNREPEDPFWKKAYNLLTLLDLCHFPLRGAEQAEALFRKTDFLKSICSWKEIESVLE